MDQELMQHQEQLTLEVEVEEQVLDQQIIQGLVEQVDQAVRESLS
jgi:hypothetical protein